MIVNKFLDWVERRFEALILVFLIGLVVIIIYTVGFRAGQRVFSIEQHNYKALQQTLTEHEKQFKYKNRLIHQLSNRIVALENK